MEPPREEISPVAQSLGWSVKRAFEFKKAARINLAELRTILVELKEWTREGGKEVRRLLLMDSRACLGAVAKGAMAVSWW